MDPLSSSLRARRRSLIQQAMAARGGRDHKQAAMKAFEAVFLDEVFAQPSFGDQVEAEEPYAQRILEANGFSFDTTTGEDGKPRKEVIVNMPDETPPNDPDGK